MATDPMFTGFVAIFYLPNYQRRDCGESALKLQAV